jgi:hypothetical protein
VSEGRERVVDGIAAAASGKKSREGLATFCLRPECLASRVPSRNTRAHLHTVVDLHNEGAYPVENSRDDISSEDDTDAWKTGWDRRRHESRMRVSVVNGSRKDQYDLLRSLSSRCVQNEIA